MAKKLLPRSPPQLLPPLPFDALAWHIFPNKFTSRTLRLLSRYLGDLRFDSLREQVYKISDVIADDLHISMTDAELSSIFGRKGSWSRGIIQEYLHQLSAPCALYPGRQRLVHEALEEEVVRLCLNRQHERVFVTFSDVIDFLNSKCIAVDRFWVRHFVQRQKERLCVQKTTMLEKDRHNVSLDDMKRNFETLAGQVKSNPSRSVWSADQMKVGCQKKASRSEVIIAVNTKPGSVTIPEVRDDAQFTLRTAISTFRNSTYPFFISKLKRFEKTLLTEQKRYEGHDHTIRSASRTFITEVLFIDWLETIFSPRIAEFRQKFASHGPSILVFDGHSTHVTL
jgi:hypothetical protein